MAPVPPSCHVVYLHGRTGRRGGEEEQFRYFRCFAFARGQHRSAPMVAVANSAVRPAAVSIPPLLRRHAINKLALHCRVGQCILKTLNLWKHLTQVFEHRKRTKKLTYVCTDRHGTFCQSEEAGRQLPIRRPTDNRGRERSEIMNHALMAEAKTKRFVSRCANVCGPPAICLFFLEWPSGRPRVLHF